MHINQINKMKNNNTLDISKPRRRYFSDGYSKDCCPECGLKLVSQSCTIIIVTKSNTEEIQFATNLNGSKFCNRCPVVVFNKDLIEQGARNSMKGEKNIKHSIIGIIDIQAIPKENQHLELGSDENPIPLVRFLPNLNFTEPKS